MWYWIPYLIAINRCVWCQDLVCWFDVIPMIKKKYKYLHIHCFCTLRRSVVMQTVGPTLTTSSHARLISHRCYDRGNSNSEVYFAASCLVYMHFMFIPQVSSSTLIGLRSLLFRRISHVVFCYLMFV